MKQHRDLSTQKYYNGQQMSIIDITEYVAQSTKASGVAVELSDVESLHVIGSLLLASVSD